MVLCSCRTLRACELFCYYGVLAIGAFSSASIDSRVGQALKISAGEGDRAVACCSRLVQIADFSRVSSPSPGRVGELLSIFIDAVHKAASICTRAAIALTRETDRYASLLDTELLAFADLEALQWQRMFHFLSNGTAIHADSRGMGDDSLAFELVGMAAFLFSGSPLTTRSAISEHDHGDGRGDTLTSPVMSTLPRFVCASAASWFLDMRLFSLVTHLMCSSSGAAPCESVEIGTPMFDVVADIINLDVIGLPHEHEQALVYDRRDPVSNTMAQSRLLHRNAVTPRWTLLIYVAPKVPLSQVRASASVLKDALDKYGEQLHVVWFEHFFLRHGPYLADFFRECSNVEVLWLPYFGLYIKDLDIWYDLPSLTRIHCSQVVCYFFDVPEQDVEYVKEDNIELDSALLENRPTEPGCWFQLPTGCFREAQISPATWKRDANGELHFSAGVDKDACVEVRRKHYNLWCGVDDTIMHYVAHSNSDPEGNGEVLLSTVLMNLFHSRTLGGLSGYAGCNDCMHFLPPLGHTQSARLWDNYLAKHSAVVSQESPLSSDQKQMGLLGLKDLGRCIIWACHPEFPCGGHGDRLKGIVATFVFALLTDRLFFIDAPDPWDLRLFMRPNRLDWRISGLRGFPGSRHILWDHDAFEASLLDDLLDSNDPVWIIYTNKKSLLGPLLRHPRLASRAQELGLFRLPHLAYHIWNVLFRPAPSLERRLHQLEGILGGKGAPYIAMHHRAGDAGNFGIINGEVDRRSGPAEILQLLSCASILEHRLGLPNTTRWYLASDGELAQQIPQVAAWQESGKLVLSWSTTSKVHIAAAGVLPPANHLEYSPASARLASPLRNPSAVEAMSSLAGVSDAWLDFLTLSRAWAIAVSSSAFGLMASQIGGVEHTYTSLGCTRVDLAV